MNIKDIDRSLLFHPEDLSGMKKMESIPGLKSFIIESVSAIREKYTAIEMTGNGVAVNEDSYPELYHLLLRTLDNLGLDLEPKLSMDWSYDISMMTEGFRNPQIVALSGCIDLLTDDELMFLLGHEMGHLALGHKPYHMLLVTIYTPLINHMPYSEIMLGILKPLLLSWYRVSDYTADRIGLLNCQDIEVALRTMVKMAGLPKKYYDSINTTAFLKQAEQFEIQCSGWADKMINNLTINAACSPWLVARASELIRWYNSDNYKNIIANASN